MKKVSAVFLILALCFSLYGCGSLYDDDGDSNISFHESAAYEDDDYESTNIIPDGDSEDENFIFSWLSYLELSVTKDRQDEESYRKYIDSLFQNMKEISVTDVFVHVRAFADALYKSELFPSSKYVCGTQGEEMPFDVLEIVIDIAKSYDINVHAWINPYRVSAEDDISSLCDSNSAKIWYNEGSTQDVVVLNGGIYFNPASLKVQKLIIDGVKELMQNYDIKGIHIDDYFYPEKCNDFDKEQYSEYIKNGGSLSLADYRREQVNSLIKAIYSCVKAHGDDKVFSISPCASIDKAYNELYADVYSWCQKDGFCDIIIPQIYFGFENETMPFEECLSSWCEITNSGNTKLVIGLSLYKVGQADTFAGVGKNEWIENDDVLKRQIECLYEKDCDGFALYSASYINFSKTFMSKQLNNIKSVLQ